MSREERTGWRDEEISLRHRRFGVNAPAVDIDFLLIEYDRAVPAALIEYKEWNARQFDIHDCSARVLISLADSAGLPLFVVRYKLYENGGDYHIKAVNQKAFQKLPKGHLEVDEPNYCRFLGQIRGRTTSL